jgi:hypothetical protein
MSITIDEKRIEAAYAVADESTKKVLDALFGRNVPDYSDYRNIKTYEDACEALGEPALQFENAPSHIAALMKLEIVSRALWGKFRPLPYARGGFCYHPLISLYADEEVAKWDPADKKYMLRTTSNYVDAAWFGCQKACQCAASTFSRGGFRLCQETEEKALYFGQQFICLWAEYLKFRFSIVKKNGK